MAKIPEPKNSTRTLIDQHHESKKDDARYHLGASLLGHHCNRWLWLSFRWAIAEKFPGRILRLFRRGQNEEAVIVDDLRAVGCIVTDEVDGRQMRVDFSRHVSGSMDGVIESGLPESPTKRHVLEIKTHSKKSFDQLEKEGVEKSKPQHYTQMQVYMAGTGIDRALYAAVCKDDDRYHFERVRYDQKHAMAAIAKGHLITAADRMPEPCAGGSASWYLCKFCPAHSFCWGGDFSDAVNCRTCSHFTARETDAHCSRWDAAIPNEHQKAGCPSHVPHPDLIPAELIGGDEVNGEYLFKEKRYKIGEGGLSSVEFMEVLRVT